MVLLKCGRMEVGLLVVVIDSSIGGGSDWWLTVHGGGQKADGGAGKLGLDARS